MSGSVSVAKGWHAEHFLCWIFGFFINLFIFYRCPINYVVPRMTPLSEIWGACAPASSMAPAPMLTSTVMNYFTYIWMTTAVQKITDKCALFKHTFSFLPLSPSAAASSDAVEGSPWCSPLVCGSSAVVPVTHRLFWRKFKDTHGVPSPPSLPYPPLLPLPPPSFPPSPSFLYPLPLEVGPLKSS